jgi:hypothetical protein
MDSGRPGSRLPNLPLLALAVALTACAAGRPVVPQDGQIVKEGFYRVDAPSGWKQLRNPASDTLHFTQVVLDAQFVCCPETQLLSFGRASYRQKAARSTPSDDQDLLKMATALVEEYHSARRNAPARTNIQSEMTTVAGARAVQVTFETELASAGFCDPSAPIGAMKERYLLVDSAGRGLGLSLHAGLHAQKFVLLHFESPTARFDDGLREFQRVADSLSFID